MAEEEVLPEGQVTEQLQATYESTVTKHYVNRSVSSKAIVGDLTVIMT